MRSDKVILSSAQFHSATTNAPTGRGRNGCDPEREIESNSSGVPFPFKLEFAAKVTNAEEVECALHRAFAPNRVNPKREFFSIEPDQAIAILKLLHIEEVTNQVQQLPKSESFMLQTDITILQRRQMVLEKRIDEALSSTPIDDPMISNLKSRIIYVKEEIERLRHEAFISYH